MLVYITSGQKTDITTINMDGLPLHHLSVGSGYLARRRAVRWLRELYASGVRRCICADAALLPLAEQVDITPYPVLPLRLALLDGLLPQMLQQKDEATDRLEMLSRPPVVTPKPPVNPPKDMPPVQKKIYKSLNRSIVFPAKRLESESDIDAYVEKMRESLKQLLKNCDGIQLK